MTDEAQEPQYENVTLEQVAEAAQQADADADEREEIAVDWNELIETPALAMTEEAFADRVAQRFEIELGLNDAQVELREVNHLGEAPDLGEGAHGAKTHFSLVFRGYGPRANLPEGIYRLRHEELGELELYLRPTQRESTDPQQPESPHLEAVFS